MRAFNLRAKFLDTSGGLEVVSAHVDPGNGIISVEIDGGGRGRGVVFSQGKLVMDFFSFFVCELSCVFSHGFLISENNLNIHFFQSSHKNFNCKIQQRLLNLMNWKYKKTL